MRGKAVSGEEYIRLCEEHTASEIAEIMKVSKGFVSKLQAKHKVKPKRECSECHKRFDPVRNEKMCPECRKTKKYKWDDEFSDSWTRNLMLAAIALLIICQVAIRVIN